jgi:hypothetical protein
MQGTEANPTWDRHKNGSFPRSHGIRQQQDADGIELVDFIAEEWDADRCYVIPQVFVRPGELVGGLSGSRPRSEIWAI